MFCCGRGCGCCDGGGGGGGGGGCCRCCGCGSLTNAVPATVCLYIPLLAYYLSGPGGGSWQQLHVAGGLILIAHAALLYKFLPESPR